MEKVAAVILAGGKGTRMGNENGSEIPKVMFKVLGKPMISHSVDNVRKAGVDKVTLVVGYKREMVMDYMGDKVDYAVQEEQLGTGHAVMMAKGNLDRKSEAVLVCYGDMPLFKPETIRRLIEDYNREKPTIAMLTVDFDDPEYWAYGRIVRDDNGDVQESIEQKDCTPEQLKIKECNPCFYVFQSDWLWNNLSKLKTENAQKEYYLTDLIGMAKELGKRIIATKVSEEKEALGVNTPDQLREAEAVLNARMESNGNIQDAGHYFKEA